MRVLSLVAAAAAANAAQIRITCIGDSITAGVCSSQTHGYPAILQGLLGSNYLVLNAGNSGKTMLKQGICGPPPSGDCSYWDTPSWPQAEASTPDLVTIMLGTNDAKNFTWFNASTGNYTADYLDMISILQALPTKPMVFPMIPPPLYPPFPYDMNETVINAEFPVLVPQIAKAGKANGFVDVFDALGGANLTLPKDFCDGCHPVDAGYELIAQVVYQTVVKAARERGWPEPRAEPGLTYPENFARV